MANEGVHKSSLDGVRAAKTYKYRVASAVERRKFWEIIWKLTARWIFSTVSIKLKTVDKVEDGSRWKPLFGMCRQGNWDVCFCNYLLPQTSTLHGQPHVNFKVSMKHLILRRTYGSRMLVAPIQNVHLLCRDRCRREQRNRCFCGEISRNGTPAPADKNPTLLTSYFREKLPLRRFWGGNSPYANKLDSGAGELLPIREDILLTKLAFCVFSVACVWLSNIHKKYRYIVGV